MILRNPFNYTASKDRIMSVLLKNFDYNKDIFIDMFCGSGVVGVNVLPKYNRVILNDGCWQIVGILRAMSNDDKFLYKVEKIIDQFGLSKTNKEAYIDARGYYNENFKDKETFNPYFLYALMMHSFNYQIVFNSSEGFSVPSGYNRSSFNSSIREKLQKYSEKLYDYDIELYSFKQELFIDLIKNSFQDDEYRDLMIYCDPPYSRSCSDSSVNRSYGLKWGEAEDKALLKFLDFLDSKGSSFVLSNVLENNGKENKLLKKWAKKYNVIPLNVDYTNCHYNRKNAGKTEEIIVRNF